MQAENETVSTLDAVEEEESFVDVMDVEQKGAVDFSLLPKNEVIGVDANVSTTQICATMKARTLPDEAVRSPVDILVALDKSGSMTGSKLELCKQTLELLLRQLLPQDRFGLITYSSEANTEVPIQLMTSENKEAALQKIKSLRSSGYTNMSAAIALAFQELRAVETPNKVRSIFLLTDGHANTGISNHDDLVELTRNCCMDTRGSDDSHIGSNEDRQPRRLFGSLWGSRGGQDKKPAVISLSDKDRTKALEASTTFPISLFCFGYGSDHNGAMLRDISDAAESGSYYHVKDDSDVGSAFGDAMGGILSVVAQSAVLTIQVPSERAGVSIKKVHHDRAIKRDHGCYTVNVGDFYAEEFRDVLIEVTLAASGGQPGMTVPVPHLSVSLTFTDILQKKPIQTGPLICSIARPSGKEVSEDNSHVAAEWLRVLVTHEMKAAERFAMQNDLVRGRERINHARGQIAMASACVQNNPMVAQLKADLDQASIGLQSQQDYYGGGDKYLSYKTQTYSHQRCSEATADSACAFQPSSKKAMAKKMKIAKK